MRKKKLAKRLGITAGVLALLLVGAEVGAQYYAERELASRVREQLKLPHDPHVDIQGLLIPQAVTSDFRQISLAADPVALSKFQQLGVQAELHHTRLPISDVLSGKINEINVDRLDASVRLSESDLGRLFGIGDLKIRPASPQDLDPSEATPTSQGGSTAPVDVTGSTNLAGQDLKVRIVGVLALEDGKLNINPKRLQLQTQRFGVISLPPMFERALMQRFNTTLDPKMLPFAITPTGVRAQEGGLIVEGQASNLVISQNGIRTR